jgi:NAD(P)-dependent dehydrogenase (short-subunit alcohol dehydrogenase family)
MRHNPGGKGGKVIVTSSVLGIYPNPTFPEYCAAKAGLNQYVRSVAPILLLHCDITVNYIAPGPIVTEVMPDFADAFPPEHMTLKTNLMQCFHHYIEDTTRKTGKTIIVAHNTLIELNHPEYSNHLSAQCWANVYDPWFKALHGVESRLPSARLSACD